MTTPSTRLRALKVGITTSLIGAGFLVAVALPAQAIEEEDQLGLWLGATSAIRYTDQWSLFLQGELRTWEPAANLNELLWRVAGQYDFDRQHRGAFGYVRVDNWPFEDGGPREFFENRLYQEYLFKQTWNNAGINHRFRLEQRWITTPEFGTELSVRARYMLQYTAPLGNDMIETGTWYFQAFNEVFVDFDRNGYYFGLQGLDAGLNQNRLFGGFGRQIGPRSSIRFGLLWQHRPNADFIRLMLSYSHNFDLRDSR